MIKVKDIRKAIENLPDDAIVYGDIVDGNSCRSTLYVAVKQGRDIFGKPALTVEINDTNDLY